MKGFIGNLARQLNKYGWYLFFLIVSIAVFQLFIIKKKYSGLNNFIGILGGLVLIFWIFIINLDMFFKTKKTYLKVGYILGILVLLFLFIEKYISDIKDNKLITYLLSLLALIVSIIFSFEFIKIIFSKKRLYAKIGPFLGLIMFIFVISISVHRGFNYNKYL